MAFNPHPRFLLRLFFVSLLVGTVVSLQAAPQGEPQAAAQDELSLDNLVRQCDEAWQHGRWVDAKKLCVAVLERADQLSDSNPKKARVLFQLVPFYGRSDDDRPQAISLLQRIVAIDETALGPEDPQVALDLRELGMQQFLKPEDAEKSFQRAVTIAEGAQQMSSGLRIQVFAGAAQFYRRQERNQEAEALLRRALELGAALPPGQRNVFLSVRVDLAATLRKEGKSDEADQLLAGPVPPGPASHGAESAPDWASPYNDFVRAREYKNQGRLQDAELHYRLALSALDRFPASAVRPFPEDIALDELADICHAQHRDAEAEDLLLRALHLREKRVSEQDPKINPNLAIMLSTPYALQNFYRDQGRLSEIEPVYKRAIEIQERNYGLTDDPVSDTLRNLASVFVEEKKFEEALPLYRHALQIKEKTLGADDPQLMAILEDLANALHELGRTAEASKTRARAKQLSIRRTRN